MRTLVLDAGALIALERREAPVLAIVAELIAARTVAQVPAGVVAQVWRGSPGQHAVIRLLRTGVLRVEPLSEEVAPGRASPLSRSDGHQLNPGVQLAQIVGVGGDDRGVHAPGEQRHVHRGTESAGPR